MAANPTTGEVFYFVEGTTAASSAASGPATKPPTNSPNSRRRWTPSPATTELLALAVNPSLSWGPLRPAGVLYGADAEDEATPKASATSSPRPRGAGKALTVSKGGGGAGTVTSSPAGIDCGSTCSAEFLEG